MFITLFITLRDWEQPKCPPVGGWINKMSHVRVTEHDSKEECVSNNTQQHGRTSRTPC